MIKIEHSNSIFLIIGFILLVSRKIKKKHGESLANYFSNSGSIADVITAVMFCSFYIGFFLTWMKFLHMGLGFGEIIVLTFTIGSEAYCIGGE